MIIKMTNLEDIAMDLSFRNMSQKSAQEVYENLKKLFPEVVDSSFNQFMSKLERIVRIAGGRSEIKR